MLLLERQDQKPQGGTWGVPAGKKQFIEEKKEAILREITEETGTNQNPNNITFFQTVYVKYPEYDFVYHIFSLPKWKNEEVRINPREHKSFRWVTPEEALQMNLIQDLDQCITLHFA
jgi:8-oxo-dGTP pyrophosphatase MutT (NUDIX family)